MADLQPYIDKHIANIIGGTESVKDAIDSTLKIADAAAKANKDTWRTPVETQDSITAQIEARKAKIAELQEQLDAYGEVMREFDR